MTTAPIRSDRLHSRHRRQTPRRLGRRLAWDVLAGLGIAAATLVGSPPARADQAAGGGLEQTVRQAQSRMVKIYGAGGVRGLEAYQSGFLISADGHILTVWSYVLDSDYVTAVLDDGRRFQATIVGTDPRLEIAVLKIPAQDLPHFELDEAVELRPGDRVLALSNLYGIAAGNEPASVMHGVVAAVAELAARRGTFASPYQGTVYVLDAVTNNAGAAGGALTNWSGQLAGLLGKELRNSRDNTWLNYALPVQVLAPSVEAIVEGRSAPRRQDQPMAQQPVSLERLGIRLVPQLLTHTPPFVDQVIPASAADMAGLRADDLVVMVNQQTVRSVEQLQAELQRIESDRPLDLVVLRDQQLVDVHIPPVP